MATTTFTTPLNSVSTHLAAPFAAGSASLTVAPGDGALFGSPTVFAPVRVTLVAASAVGVNGEILDRSKTATFKCTGVSGDVLTVTTSPIEGTAQSFSTGDTVAVLVTAGSLSDIHTAVNNAETTISTNSGNIASNTSAITALQGHTGGVVGGTVSGGTAGRLLFEGTGSVLADSPNLTYANGTLGIAAASLSQVPLGITLASGQTANGLELRGSNNHLYLAANPTGVLLWDRTDTAVGSGVYLQKFTVDSGSNFNIGVTPFANATYNGATVPSNDVISLGWNVAPNGSAENTAYYYSRIGMERGWVWTNGGGAGVDLLQSEIHLGAIGATGGGGLTDTGGDRIRGLSWYTRLDGSYKTTGNLQASVFNFVDDSAAQGRAMLTLTRSTSSDLSLQGFDASGVTGFQVTLPAAGTTDALVLGRTASTEGVLTIQAKQAELALASAVSSWNVLTGSGGTDPALYLQGPSGSQWAFTGGSGYDGAHANFGSRLMVGYVGATPVATLDVYQTATGTDIATFRNTVGSTLVKIDKNGNLTGQQATFSGAPGAGSYALGVGRTVSAPNSDYGADINLIATAANASGGITASRAIAFTEHTSGTINTSIAINTIAWNTNAGLVNNQYALVASNTNAGTGTITNCYGIDIQNASNTGGGTITNQYGLYLGAMTAATTNYAIYSAGGQSYHAGRLGLGAASTPGALLDVRENTNYYAATISNANTGANAGCLALTPGNDTAAALEILDHTSNIVQHVFRGDGSALLKGAVQAGQLGIGIAPSHALDISANANAYAATIGNSNAGTSAGGLAITPGNDTAHALSIFDHTSSIFAHYFHGNGDAYHSGTLTTNAVSAGTLTCTGSLGAISVNGRTGGGNFILYSPDSTYFAIYDAGDLFKFYSTGNAWVSGKQAIGANTFNAQLNVYAPGTSAKALDIVSSQAQAVGNTVDVRFFVPTLGITTPDTENHYLAKISVESLNTGNADADMIFYTNTALTLSERMRLTKDGRLVIGAQTAYTPLDVHLGTNKNLRVRDNSGTEVYAASDDNSVYEPLHLGGLPLALNSTTGASTVVGGSVATTASDGFLYIPTCAGAPTGTPTAQTGTVPLVFDTTDSKLFIYTGGTWKSATFA